MALSKGYFITQYRDKTVEELKEELKSCKSRLQQKPKQSVDDDGVLSKLNKIQAIEQLLIESGEQIQPTIIKDPDFNVEVKCAANNDPFWEKVFRDFFDKLTNKSENEKLEFIRRILNKKLVNEFSKDVINCTDANALFDKYSYNKNLICPNCGETLTYMMPDGKKLYCYKCNKYFINDNGIVGAETSSPYSKDNILY